MESFGPSILTGEPLTLTRWSLIDIWHLWRWFWATSPLASANGLSWLPRLPEATAALRQICTSCWSSSAPSCLAGLDERSSHLLAGIALVLPALLTAGWTMPRSDTDGLWILIYPLLVILAGTAYLVHRLRGSRSTEMGLSAPVRRVCEMGPSID